MEEPMGERTAAQAQPFALVHAYAANTHHNGSGPTTSGLETVAGSKTRERDYP